MKSDYRSFSDRDEKRQTKMIMFVYQPKKHLETLKQWKKLCIHCSETRIHSIQKRFIHNQKYLQH